MHFIVDGKNSNHTVMFRCVGSDICFGFSIGKFYNNFSNRSKSVAMEVRVDPSFNMLIIPWKNEKGEVIFEDCNIFNIFPSG